MNFEISADANKSVIFYICLVRKPRILLSKSIAYLGCFIENILRICEKLVLNSLIEVHKDLRDYELYPIKSYEKKSQSLYRGSEDIEV